jgi:S1-C subfamily serine protease
MVAQPLDHPAVDSTPPMPPTPPNQRGPRRIPTILAGLLILGGSLGGGALGASAVMSRNQAAAVVSTSPTTAAASTSVSAPSAASLYQQTVAGAVTITTEIARRGAVGQGTGSGIVVDQNGDIVTNAHVVAGAHQVQVTFADGRTAPATIVSVNSNADLAVLRVSVAASSLHPVTLGNSDTLQIGHTVYAIGAPFGLTESMSAGIVSGLNRAASGLSGLIQTDAPINPGNSGGALVNAQGQVIGINDSIESPVQGNVGIGFAIPINAVKALLPSSQAT